MPLSPESRVALFPTSGAIPEILQIGRTAIIDRITARALGGETQLLFEDRHLGKSSVLRAMADRSLRDVDDHRIVLSVDLRDGISDSQALARQLLDQAAHQGSGLKIAALARRGALKRMARPLREGLTSAGELLGLEDPAAILAAISDGLTPTGEVSLNDALKALDARGHAASARGRCA